MAFFPQGFTPGTVRGTKDTIGNQNTMSLLSLGLETSLTALQGRMAVRKAKYPPADSLPSGSGSSGTALGTWGHHLGTLVSHCPACPPPPPGSQLEPWTPAGTDSPLPTPSRGLLLACLTSPQMGTP